MTLAPAIILALTGAAVAGDPTTGALFRVGDQRADHAVITTGETIGKADHSSPMLSLLDGVVADLDVRTLNQLKAAVEAGRQAAIDPGAHRFAFVHLQAKSATRRLEIVVNSDGAIVLRDPSGPADEPSAARLDREKMLAMIFSPTDPWPLYRGTFADTGLPQSRQASATQTWTAGEVFPLEKPFAPGWFIIDKPTLSSRFLRGRETRIDRADRLLESESFSIRLPKAYSPNTPAGLLVWINAGDSGSPPPEFDQTLDALNIICIGPANCGNRRPSANRYQLALDAAATASERFHVDPRRVYTAGISGGGRIATTLAGCFPDVFAGSVGIVGLSCYQNVPAGGRTSWPAAYSQPAPRLFDLLRQRRIAAVTGGQDFNQVEITIAGQLMRADGLQAKVFEYGDMGHSLPTSERFDEVLKWVDQPRQEARAAEEAEAARLLKSYTDRNGDKPPTTSAQRADLVKITQAGPWTPAAWEAARRFRDAKSN